MAAVEWVRDELVAGLEGLKREGIPIRTEKFPIEVRIRAGRGISHSFHGKGPIVLFRVGRRMAPVIHELTHVLAGYTRANGHWSTEGLASWMQDRYGAWPVFPTFRKAQSVARLLFERDAALPMIAVMKERDRSGYFGVRNMWQRWLAYAQSCAFAGWLIEKFGMDRFLRIYDKPYETAPFAAVYGRDAERLVAEWRAGLATVAFDRPSAEAIFRRSESLFR